MPKRKPATDERKHKALPYTRVRLECMYAMDGTVKQLASISIRFSWLEIPYRKFVEIFFQSLNIKPTVADLEKVKKAETIIAQDRAERFDSAKQLALKFEKLGEKLS